jgi:hypothetical protein
VFWRRARPEIGAAKVLQFRNMLQRPSRNCTLRRLQETIMHRLSALAVGALCLVAQTASATTKEKDHFLPIELMSDQMVFADVDSKATNGATVTLWSLVVFAKPVAFGNGIMGTIAEANWSFDCTAGTYSEVSDAVFNDAGTNVYNGAGDQNQPDDPQTVEGAMFEYACKGTTRLTNSSTYDTRTDAIKIGQYQFNQLPLANPPAPPAPPAPATPPATH